MHDDIQLVVLPIVRVLEKWVKYILKKKNDVIGSSIACPTGRGKIFFQDYFFNNRLYTISTVYPQKERIYSRYHVLRAARCIKTDVAVE